MKTVAVNTSNKQLQKMYVIIIGSIEIPNQSYNWDTGNPCGEKFVVNIR
jgi:hypothetical protein